jgi:hypothetical protein
VRALPRVPERIPILDPTIWQRTRRAFADGTAGVTEHYHAASQLIFDVWLWMMRAYDTRAESPFEQLALLTRDLDAPPLRVAHCIRDFAYGQEDKIQLLKKLVASNQTEYRTLFEAAFWRSPEEERKK